MEYHEKWEEVAKTDGAHRAIASGNWQNEEFYNLSGIITASKLTSQVERLYGEKCKNLTVVEIGCGTGRETKYFADCFKNVIAIDASPTMIEKAKLRVNSPKVDFQVNKVGEIPIFDGDADIVYSFIVFQHCSFDTVKKYFKSAQKALRVGGRFMFQLGTEKNKDFEPLDFNDVGVRRKETLIKDLEEAGFLPEYIAGDHFGLHIAIKR